jgi:hypothetical protein
MKQIAKFFTLAIILIAYTVTTFGQVGATTSATATATIITPITIASTTQMNFGNIAVNNTTGTVDLSTGSGRTPSGGVTLPTPTGTVTAAVFHVTGIVGATYSITLPTADYTISSGGNNMIVNGFVSSPATNGSLATGAEDISVGATLNVGASQPAGIYTNAVGFDVTVNYN